MVFGFRVRAVITTSIPLRIYLNIRASEKGEDGWGEQRKHEKCPKKRKSSRFFTRGWIATTISSQSYNEHLGTTS